MSENEPYQKLVYLKNNCFFPRRSCRSVSSCNFFSMVIQTVLSARWDCRVGLGMRRQEHSVETNIAEEVVVKSQCKEAGLV